MDRSRKKVEELTDRLGDYAELGKYIKPEDLPKIVKLAKRNRDLEGMVINLRNRGTGRDHPPCWINAQGEIEFTYEVKVEESEFTIRLILPEYRIEDLIQISNDPTIRQLGKMRRPEFTKKMRPFFSYGRSANPQCRFWVKVIDNTGPTSKDLWKSGLATIEGFFYKELRK